jgi:hypothetical protein
MESSLLPTYLMSAIALFVPTLWMGIKAKISRPVVKKEAR